MAELGAPWGSESASDRVWPGGRPPSSHGTKTKTKAKASGELAAKHARQERVAAEKRGKAQAKRDGEQGSVAEAEPRGVRSSLLAPEPEPEPEPEPLEGMAPGQIFEELVSRGLVDPTAKKNRPSEQEQREMLRACFDDEGGRAYAVRLAEVDLPARAYAESRSRLIGRMMFRKAASEALKHGQNEAEIALTRPSAPPVHEEWAADEDPEPARLDTMARWAVPVRRRRRVTGAASMRAMTPSDVKAREQRIAAEAAKAMRVKGRRNGRTSASSLGSQPGPRQRRAKAATNTKNSSASKPQRRSMGGARSVTWRPTHGKAGTGFEIQIGCGLCMEGLGMVRPSTAPDPSQLTACVLDNRLRTRNRRLRVSPNGLHRPATAPPSRNVDDGGSRRSSSSSDPSSSSDLSTSGGSSLAEIMVIDEDGHDVISDIESPHTTHGASVGRDDQHSSAWLDGTELAAINGISDKMDDHLHHMKDCLTHRLAVAKQDKLSAEQQRTIEQALAGLVALEQQLLGSPAVQQHPTTCGSPRTQTWQPMDWHTSRLLATTTSAQNKAVRGQLIADCRKRVLQLQDECNRLKQKLQLVERSSSHGRHQSDQMRRILLVKEQETEQLQMHKRELEEQVYKQGDVTVEQQKRINEIKQRMELEMEHARLMLEEYRSHAEQVAGDLAETKNNLGQARQQLVVAKSFAKQLEDRTHAVTYKLRLSEQQKTEAEEALARSQRQLETLSRAGVHASDRPPSPSSRRVRDAIAEMGRRRLEHQLQAARHQLEVQQLEMEELKELKKQWQETSGQEYAPDGTRLGQDVPDFEDTADHGHGVDGSFPSAPQQPRPKQALDMRPARPSSAHPKLQKQGQTKAVSSLESELLTTKEASLAKDGTQLSISLGERGAFKKVMKESMESVEPSSSSAFSRPVSAPRQTSSDVYIEASVSTSISSDVESDDSKGPPFINRHK